MNHYELVVLFIFLSFRSAFGQDPNVEILSTDPALHPVLEQIVQEKDKDVQLTCVVEHRPPGHNVLWTVQDLEGINSPISVSEATKSFDAFRWAIDTPSATSWRLRIQNAQVADEGIYECKVQTVSLSYVTDRRELVIVQTPKISDLTTSNDMVKDEDSDANMECYATGRPTPLVKWTRMAGELLPNGGTEFQGNVLTIDRLSADHAGIYKCTAENSAGEDERTIRLTVRFRPEVYVAYDTVYQKVGYRKELVCNIKGYPPPTSDEIGWTHEGEPVIPDGRINIRNIPGASNRITSILEFNGVREEDFGRYTCSASNGRGSRSVAMGLESSQIPTPDRSGIVRSRAAGFVSVHLATLLMLLSVSFLHNFHYER